MLRLKDVPPEEMAEVVRVAGALYDRESAEARERKATIDAAVEMEIPEAYLERAAAEVHARRVEQVRRKQQRRGGVLVALVAAVGIGGGTLFLRTPPPAAWTLDTGAPAVVTLDKNAQTRAVTTVEDGATTLWVERFGKEADGDYYANLAMEPPPTLSGYQTVRLRVRGEGGLRQARLYLENGPTERWRSPAIALTEDWRTVTLPLHRFERQTRAQAGGNWRVTTQRAPGSVRQLSLKVGEFMNDVSARGKAAVDDVRFE
jgi:hypothetical protein